MATRQWLKRIVFYTLLVFTTAASASISGTIFRDYDLSGTQDLLEPGVNNITVTAYNDAGAAVATVTTIANGSYTLGTGAGAYRVEVTGVPTYLNPGTAITGGTQALTSVISDGTTHNVSLNNAGEYCQADPSFIMARSTKGARTGANTGINTVLQYPYTANDTDAPTNIATYAQLGSIYGVAHLRKANKTYVSTFFKRHVDIGTAGIGAIYEIDHTTANVVSTFALLPGTDPRNAGLGYDWDHDTNGYADVGKTGVGDIEISDDESQLFAVNMEDRRLYVVDVDANGDAGATASYAIPNACANSLDFRPMGLGFNDGVLYVGVTCTAESTVSIDDPDDSYFGPRKGDSSQLSAHVYAFNPTTNLFNAAPVVNIDLDYGRGCIYDNDISNLATPPPGGCAQIPDKDGVPRAFVANWLPWQMDSEVVFNDKNPGNVGNALITIEYPQPLLSDIEFDNDGSMIIQIRDLNGDKTGYENFSPDPANVVARRGNGMGDMLKACGNPQIGWTLESNGSCGGITTGGAGNQEGPGGGEFYWYDNGPGGNGNVSGGTNGHGDTTAGGLLHIPGYPDVITGIMDSHNFYNTGLGWFRNDTGEISLDGGTPKRLLVSPINASTFLGKANGIGDLEMLCDPAPIEIGNYVWDDVDGDGIQDPSEAGLAGVTVLLYEGGTQVGSAITGANGEYYFGGLADTNMSGGNIVEPLTDYQIRIANIVGRVPTQQDVNSNTGDLHDNDGDNGILNAGFSTIEHTTGTAGANDHTLDFGFAVPGSWSGNVSQDTTGNNIGDTNLPGVTIELFTDPNGDGDPSDGVSVGTTMTNGSGDYVFNNLVPGDYVAVETQPVPLVNVSEDEGGLDNDDNGNSTNNNQISGTVGPGEADVNNDFVEKIGGSWSGNVSQDINNDDIGDVNLQGVVITLFADIDGDGQPDGVAIAVTTTDANGNYIFNDLSPGDYVAVETQPAGLVNVSEDEGGLDNDDHGSAIDNNQISGTVSAGENDVNNDFVERQNLTPVDIPTLAFWMQIFLSLMIVGLVYLRRREEA